MKMQIIFPSYIYDMLNSPSFIAVNISCFTVVHVVSGHISQGFSLPGWSARQSAVFARGSDRASGILCISKRSWGSRSAVPHHVCHLPTPLALLLGQGLFWSRLCWPGVGEVNSAVQSHMAFFPAMVAFDHPVWSTASPSRSFLSLQLPWLSPFLDPEA